MYLALSGTEEIFRKGTSIRVLIAAAQKYNIDALEIWHPKNTEVEGLDQSVALVEEAGLKVACVSTWTHLCWMGDVASQQALLVEGVRLAARLGAPFANTYFGHAAEVDDAKAIATYMQNLQPVLAVAEELGVTLVLENEFDALGDDPAQSDITRRPERIAELVEAIGSPHFRLTLDACNFYFAGVEPVPYAFDVLAPYIAYVHLKDGTRYRPGAHPADSRIFTDHSGTYVCAPVGAGAINHELLLTRLRAVGYRGYLALEPHVSPGQLPQAYAATLEYLRSRI